MSVLKRRKKMNPFNQQRAYLALSVLLIMGLIVVTSCTPAIAQQNVNVTDHYKYVVMKHPRQVEVCENVSVGGDLDVNGNDIISTGTNDIVLDPAVGQDVVIKGNATDGSGKIILNCEDNSHGIKIKGPPHSAGATYTLTLPDAIPTATGLFLTSDTSGNLSFASVM